MLAPRTVVVGTLCVVAAAALVMSRKTSVINWVAEVDASGNVQHLERVDTFEPAAAAAFAVPAPASAPAQVKNNVSPSLSRSASPTGTLEPAPKYVEPAPAAYQFAKEPEAAPESQARLVPASLRTTESAPEPAAPASEQAAAAVPATIVGCLGKTENTFWLKNVSGDDAPKSRSWKSGFLRKKSSNVALVDRGGVSNRLAAYVGRRIETTGALADHEMHVKTLRVLGSCD